MFSAADHFMNQSLFLVSWMFASWFTFPRAPSASVSRVEVKSALISASMRKEKDFIVRLLLMLKSPWIRAMDVQIRSDNKSIPVNLQNSLEKESLTFYDSQIFIIRFYDSKNKRFERTNKTENFSMLETLKHQLLCLKVEDLQEVVHSMYETFLTTCNNLKFIIVFTIDCWLRWK